MNTKDTRAPLDWMHADEAARRAEAQGATVVGWHTVPALSKPSELWASKHVRRTFLAVQARAAEIGAELQQSAPNAAVSLRYLRERVVREATQQQRPLLQEFARRYPTLWRAATNPSTDPDEVKVMLYLIDEAEAVRIKRVAEEVCSVGK